MIFLQCLFVAIAVKVKLYIRRRLRLIYQPSFNRGLTCAADGEALLNGTIPVPDSYFTASSEYPGWGAPQARLRDDGVVTGWGPSTEEVDANPHRRVTFR